MIRHRAFAALLLAATLALPSAVLSQPAPAADPVAVAALAERLAVADPVAGERAAAPCLGCHTVTEGGATITGPNLFGIVGAPIARTEGFAYSPAMRALGAAGGIWTYELLDTFIASPFLAVLGTRMGFGGISDKGTRANVIAWLRLQAPEPVALPGVAEAAAPQPVYQAYQADSGLLYFGVQTCGDCHGPTGGGTDLGPPLKGPEFEANWEGRTVWDLFAYTRRNMPPNGAGGMEDQLVARILAYVLRINGYVGGEDPFNVTRSDLEPRVFRF